MISRPLEDVGIDYIINDPVNVQGVKKIGAKRAPDHGEHSAEVLDEMGYSEIEIRSLKDQGVI
jgi:formyl-CoA transferase